MKLQRLIRFSSSSIRSSIVVHSEKRTILRSLLEELVEQFVETFELGREARLLLVDQVACCRRTCGHQQRLLQPQQVHLA